MDWIEGDNAMRIKFIILGYLLLGAAMSFAQDSLKTGTTDRQQDQTVKHGPRFVDENGDGFNDNAPDHDGDGIPNGLDPDYQGQKNRHRHAFKDLDGDGIDDNLIESDQAGKQHQFGPEGTREGNQTPGEEGAREKHQRRRGKEQP